LDPQGSLRVKENTIAKRERHETALQSESNQEKKSYHEKERVRLHARERMV
jgi:hypothetical protein